LVFLFAALGGLWIADIVRERHPQLELDNIGFFSQRHSDNEELPAQKIPAGSQVVVQTGRGDISVHAGDSDDVRVAIAKSASAPTESSAQDGLRAVRVVIEHSGNGYVIHPVAQDETGGSISVDLDVELPKKVTLTASSARGDISI